LSVEDLVKVLCEPKNAVMKQYQTLFALDHVSLKFTDDAIHAIAEKAHNAGTGARALRMILEGLMRDLMFDVPSDDTIEEVVIEKETVTDGKKPIITRSESA
jgi:ATP-dependent Clp protease ATP-binding subunit ClpX